MEILENETTTRDKISLNGLGTKKCKYGGASMMLKTGMEAAKDYNFSNMYPQYHRKI